MEWTQLIIMIVFHCLMINHGIFNFFWNFLPQKKHFQYFFFVKKKVQWFVKVFQFLICNGQSSIKKSPHWKFIIFRWIKKSISAKFRKYWKSKGVKISNLSLKKNTFLYKILDFFKWWFSAASFPSLPFPPTCHKLKHLLIIMPKSPNFKFLDTILQKPFGRLSPLPLRQVTLNWQGRVVNPDCTSRQGIKELWRRFKFCPTCTSRKSSLPAKYNKCATLIQFFKKPVVFLFT